MSKPSKGVVACGHPLTAEAAADVLADGGNAFDAMIAAVFTACLAEPVLSSIGGGGFCLARRASEVKVFDFFTQTPKLRLKPEEAEFYSATVDFGSTTQEFHIGNAAVAVPGIVHGLFSIHQHLGSIPMPRLAEYAINLAKRGVMVNEYQAYIYSLVSPIFLDTASSRALFESKREPGQIAKTGEVLTNLEFADFLDVLSREGADLFYKGEIAALIERECAAGGSLCQDDLAAYQTEIRAPFEFDFNGWRVSTNPPPSAGGSLIGFAMKLLESGLEASDGFGSLAHLGILRDAMALTSEARLASMDNHADYAVLHDNDWLARYQKSVMSHARAYRGTTHLSIIDRHGDVAACTISNGEGCGRILPGTGVMLNNMLGEEDLNPGGFFKWQADQRMSSMMAPTLAQGAHGELLATGSGGSNRIRSAITQVLLNKLHYDLPLQAAVDAPRIHFENEVTYIEGGHDSALLSQLIPHCKAHKVWDDKNMFFGGVHSAMVGRDGRVVGASDPRRGGAVMVV